MKKTSPILLSLALAAFAVQAEQISPQQAEAIARQFMNKSSEINTLGSGNDDVKVAYTAKSQVNAGSSLLYVVNGGQEEGYVVIAGDDVASVPVLGYSASGTFDYDKAPENLKYWLSEYGRQIDYMIANGMTAADMLAVPTFDTQVEPLVTSKWDQDSPYGDLCPNGISGCVATAMAQVMNYNEWPERGTGSNSYYDSYSGSYVSANFDVEYRWDLMLDEYDMESSEESRNAVATLMYHCGVASNMSYMQGASGALSQNAVAALVENFGYPADVQILYRDYRPYEEWIDLIKGQLDAGSPVLLGAMSTGGGHEFVIDGYNTEGYFHVNWGWSGLSDGYFLITSLNPYSQGIGGGSESGFKYGQDLIINLDRPTGDEVETYELYCEGLRAGTASATLGSTARLTVGQTVNGGRQDASIRLGVVIKDENGEEVASSFGTATSSAMSMGYISYGNKTVSFDIPESLTDGVYRVYPAYCHADDAERIGYLHINQNESQYLVMTVSDGVATFEASAPLYSQLSTANIVVTGNPTFASGKVAEITVDITNNGEEDFAGLLSFALLSETSDAIVYSGSVTDYYGYPTGDFDTYVIGAGETETIEMALNISNFNAANDYYRVAVVSENMDIIGTPQLVKVNNPNISCVGFPQINGMDGTETVENVDANEITASITFRNSSNDEYEGIVRAEILEEGGATLATLDSQSIVIEVGETVTVNFSGSFPEAEEGQTYLLCGYDAANNKLMLPYYRRFVVATAYGTSGVDDVAGDDAPRAVGLVGAISIVGDASNVEVYTIGGSLVSKGDASRIECQSGVYIVKVDGSLQKVIVK